MFFSLVKRKDQLYIDRKGMPLVEPTSGHFGLTKTGRKVAERFYWKGMVADVHSLVSEIVSDYAPINVMPHHPPPGTCGDLTYM